MQDDGTAPAAFTSTAAQRQGRFSLAALEAALDDLRERRELFLGRYASAGPLERFRGGQGIVQFMHVEQTQQDFAVKVRGPQRDVASSGGAGW